MKRSLSILLAIVTLLCFSTTASANTVNKKSFEPVDSEIQAPLQLPDIISKEEATDEEYLKRLKSEERDLNTLVFEKADGTKSMRMFSHPVKYVSTNGDIKDISLNIKEQNNGNFISADHGVVTLFEKNLSDGIALQYNDINLRLTPLLLESSYSTAQLSSNSKYVTYQLTENTSLEYQLTYSGFKEDIVVTQYTGQTEYVFNLCTNGLSLCEENRAYYLKDSNNVVKATLGDIIIFTADERNNAFGSMSHKVIQNNQEYQITIHLDPEYLSSPQTAYPLRIDPTIEVNYDAYGAGAIEDVTVAQGVAYSTTSGSLQVGRMDSNSIARTLMRFPNLSMPVTFAPMILSAQVEIRDVMCQDDEDFDVLCAVYEESYPAWNNSSSPTWSNTVQSRTFNTVLDSHTISYGLGNVSAHRYSFDITALARKWADGTNSPGKGIIFKATDAFESSTNAQYWNKTFASYNKSTYKPSLTIEYETSAVFSLSNSSLYLTANSQGTNGANFSSSLGTLSGKQMWHIEYLSDSNLYNIVSMGVRVDNGDSPAVLYNTSGVSGLTLKDNSQLNTKYSIQASSTSGNYYFQNAANDFYLCRSSSSLGVISSKSSTSLLSVTKYPSNLFNNFWGGSFTTGIYSGVLHVKIILDSSINSHELFEDNYFSTALYWNDILDNVIIYPAGATVPDGITPLYVTFKAEPVWLIETAARTIPNGLSISEFNALSPEQEKDLLSSNWNSVTVYMNGHTPKENNTDDNTNPFYDSSLITSTYDQQTLINKTITHEMGHALKLSHMTDDYNIHEFPNAFGAFSGNAQVYSVMNQGIPWDVGKPTQALTAARPQAIDIINFTNKWKNHLLCSH